jgi:hypothetical protein
VVTEDTIGVTTGENVMAIMEDITFVEDMTSMEVNFIIAIVILIGIGGSDLIPSTMGTDILIIIMDTLVTTTITIIHTIMVGEKKSWGVRST